MRFRFLSACAALIALAVVLLAVSAASADDAAKATYIVQMLDQPAVAYEGGLSGLPATKPAAGAKIDPNAADVKKYVDYLTGKHDEALGKVGGGQKLYDYGFSFNGFAAVLTEGQADRLEGLKNVVAVTPDAQNPVDTFTTPSFLGLTGATGFWQTTGAVGEDVVIGMVDTGVWPESRSFTDRTGVNPVGKNAKLDYQQIPGWHGKCTPGEAFNASMCNQKLIAAQAYFQGRLASLAIPDWEYLSPRDFLGHGSHTSSTAGGNFGIPTTGDAAAAGLTSVNGIAPRARIAAYKVCYDDGTGLGTCFTSDTLMAINQAVADGVDVINYSISGSRTNFLDPVQVAFFNAAAVGVFVSASAGNTPGASTVNHPGPWLTTVAATTHNRAGNGSVTLGNGMTFFGASFNSTSTGSKPFVDSEDAGKAGADPTQVRLCYPNTLDPAVVTGKIVLCDRGVIARIDKSFAVKLAGGAGMVMTNTSPIGTNADLHFVPSVHLESTDRAAVKAYANTAGATATVNAATVDLAAPAPFRASFSSQGPLLAGGGDLLKPDMSAPGVDVLAAVAPPGNRTREFDLYSGTSMSAPHIAGVAALLKDLHPDWTPAMIKSAMMTTAYDLMGTVNPFDQGAGFVDPKKAADPGLVYPSGPVDWIKFLCGTGQLTGSLCTTFGSIDPSDLNLASIAIGDLPGTQTVHRWVRNVGDSTEEYTASVSGLAGIDVDVDPSSFTIAPGATQMIEITFTRDSASLSSYQTGFLTWTGDDGHGVRSPVAIRPVAIAAPAEVSGTAAGISYSVKTGYAGTLNFAARGLVAATETDTSVAQDPDQNFDPADPTGTFSKDIVVPAGQKLFRVGIDEDFITPSGTDLDVYVYRGGVLRGLAADGDSDEMVTFANPVAGTYTVYVHGFATNGPSANFTLFEWQLGSASAGNMTVPGPVATTIGGAVPVNLSFTGLVADMWYLGQVVYNDGTSDIGTTIVNVR